MKAPPLSHEADEVTGPLYDYLGHFTRPEYLRAGHNTMRTKPGRPKKTEALVQEAFHEVMHDEPSTVQRADVSEARKQKMRIAIALNKARKAGAKIPKKKGA